MTPHDISCRDELQKRIEEVKFTSPVAITLTMKKRNGGRWADSIVASENFRQLRNRIEHLLLGSAAKQYGRRLLMVSVVEISADNRLHYHCIINRPYHCSFERFCLIVREQWQKTDFGYNEVYLQDQANEGWINYILKQRQKSSLLDSIDWNNCQLIAG
jgi:hypothetical protein